MSQISLLDGLNAEQYQAVTHRGGPLLVFAGAGSGKTRVITRRIAHAIAQGWVRPEAVVALTFTNKAAREMHDRVNALSGAGAAGLTIGTFHSTCARWLRVYGPRFGVRANFVIYDTDDQIAMIKRVLQDLSLDGGELSPREIATWLDRAKNEGQGPGDVARAGIGLLGEKFADIYARYEERLGQANALDFGDLLLRMVRLLEGEAGAFFRGRFGMILVDEYQDTNRCQYRLLKLLAATEAPEICVVGDDDQSIYRFRGADVGNILAFRKDFAGTTVIKLEENYRSTQAILDVANAVIRGNARREPKRLRAARAGGVKPRLFVHADERDEAVWAARELEAHLRSGGRLAECAILFRQNSQSRIFEEILSRARLPFLLIGGQRFYERAEVKDALAYLRLIVHPESDIDLLRVINTPARGIGDKTVERLAARAAERRVPLIDVVLAGDLRDAGLGAAAADKVAHFAAMVRGWMARAPQAPPEKMLAEILDESGLAAQFRQGAGEPQDPAAAARLQNLAELVSAVKEWSLERPTGTLTDYLEELALLTDLDRADASRDRVMLMTLHAAKGLEFKKVLLVGLEEGVFPVARGEMDAADYEEERRLFYVGVTRAMDDLALSGAESRLVYGQRQDMNPSRFLREVPRELLARTHIERAPRGEPGFTRGRAADAPDAREHPAIGKTAQHNIFGAGRVVAVHNEDGRVKYVIDFASVGRKTVVAQYVQLVRE